MWRNLPYLTLLTLHDGFPNQVDPVEERGTEQTSKRASEQTSNRAADGDRWTAVGGRRTADGDRRSSLVARLGIAKSHYAYLLTLLTYLTLPYFTLLTLHDP